MVVRMCSHNFFDNFLYNAIYGLWYASRNHENDIWGSSKAIIQHWIHKLLYRWNLIGVVILVVNAWWSSIDVTKCGGCLIVGQDVISQKLVLVAKFNCNKRYSKKRSAKFNHSIPTNLLFWWTWLLLGIECAPMLLVRVECVYGQVQVMEKWLIHYSFAFWCKYWLMIFCRISKFLNA
jgi:hypothetical protein